MHGMDDVLGRCRIERATLERWVALSWVRPLTHDGGWQFSETDVARIELICDLHRELDIDEGAIEVILPLLDQLYGLRRQLRALNDAIGQLPEDLRHDLRARFSPADDV